MPPNAKAPSARRVELLERAYGYALAHGLADLSLRPLAAAIGSSPRVLLFLFGSKEGLVRALLERARQDEVALLARVRAEVGTATLVPLTRAIWGWLAAAPHRPLLTLWVEAYGRSLLEPDGPWSAFARQTVQDWLDLLTGTPQAPWAGAGTDAAEATLAL
ncbi:MAG TPA: TetR/AcrR family transcriptional regulator, partial [Acidimicrobiales bacterium]|nr:TetR/AcrR family transcriptional regulator [Acidimicrobiales bacterium]